MGHGSNVRGLETTATYVAASDEWDVHTPTLTATKWWPGNLGTLPSARGAKVALRNVVCSYLNQVSIDLILISMPLPSPLTGKTSTHAAVMARLITADGVDHGVHAFMVPIRSLDDHRPLPGVTVGDIGDTMGTNNNDNGFLRCGAARGGL